MYYHISTWSDNLEVGDTKIFSPRIPINGYMDDYGNCIEDMKTPRVCLCKSIYGCILAKDFSSTSFKNINIDQVRYQKLFIYGVESIPNILIPRKIRKSKNDRYYTGVVPDAHISGEVWSLSKIKLTLLYYFNWSEMSDCGKQHKKILLSLWNNEYDRLMKSEK